MSREDSTDDPVFTTPVYGDPIEPVFTAPDHGPSTPPPDADIYPVQRTLSAPHPPTEGTIRRRATNATTAFKAFDSFDNGEVNWPGWHPGSEPGFDPNKPDGGHASVSTLSAPCEITVVDFSQADMRIRRFDNAGFVEFLELPEPAFAKCRWINVNGVSWDVIQALGTHKNLHKLAIEDIMNTMNRTKCDWYPNHAFIVLTLQKLVHLVDPDASSDSDSDSSESESECSSTHSSHKSRKKPLKTISTFFRHLVRGRRPSTPTVPSRRARARDFAGNKARGARPNPPPTTYPYLHNTQSIPRLVPMRSLQRYRASPNEARSEFMEAHSSLAPKGLAVSAEQVSIFLLADNTVISFFELSAEDVERPIVKRLLTPGTVLRQSCDASMIVQAIIDAIIDLAVPLTSVYSDVIGDLELDVLTSPSVKQSRSLYIIISEINKMLAFLNPIDNLLSVLRDHRTELSQEAATRVLQNDGTGVIVTPMTHTYLGDVLDQCMVVTEALHQNKQSADNLINLIFNTISAAQNESMRQLTTATIVFLPLTFLTGYFGMNFEPFHELGRGTPFFWMLAIPTVVATIIVLMRNFLYSWAVELVQRHRIVGARKKKARKQQKIRRQKAAKKDKEGAV
ncbi:related to Mg2 transporter protein, CorA-like [Cephalotrichum gorgonifer]|uniref:Related to Mg2 transporter protein, CorA-like n=1 Tax=Cephalotrichum gorgonifer TaxID=2041049 RepID=A0AAE8N4Y3_9PEZI|nr:related to Mg2 transporter protein, CorA-like [Cephalotrichum gorgonifer]